MSVKLVQLAKGKIIGTDDIHLEELIQVDTNVPSSYVAMWDISKGENDKVKAYLTGSGSNLSLHIYGVGEMKNFAQLSLQQSPYYTAPWASYSSRIKHIYIHDGVTSIGQFTFFGYHGNYSSFYSLSTLSISNTVRTINRYAFYYALISDITIPEGVRRIHEGAFGLYSTASVSVTIPNSVCIIDYSAFLNTQWFNGLPNGFTTVGDGCLVQYVGSSTQLTLPQGTKCVSLFNWSNKSSCTSVTLPNSIKYLAVGAFSGFSSLSSVKLPQGCRRISFNAFSSDSNLRAVFIPQSVTEISSRSIMTATGEMSCIPGLSPFYGANSNLKIYCEAAEKPVAFDEYWDYTGADTRATVYWGVSEQEYDAIQNGGNV